LKQKREDLIRELETVEDQLTTLENPKIWHRIRLLQPRLQDIFPKELSKIYYTTATCGIFAVKNLKTS
jgi:hypothetical protein